MPDVSDCIKNDAKKQTYEELKSNTTWQEVDVTSLSPYVTYQVTVTAVNERGLGQESKQQFKSQSEGNDICFNAWLFSREWMCVEKQPQLFN